MMEPEPVEGDKLAQLLHEFGDKANARAVFGEPVRVGDLTVIPVAQVAWKAGRGRWFGPRLLARFGPRFAHFTRGAPPPEGPATERSPEAPTGETGEMPANRPFGPFGAGRIGGQLLVRPIAALEIGPNGTHVRPILDTTTWLLGLFALIGWNVYWVTRTLRAIFGRRRRRQETIDAG